MRRLIFGLATLVALCGCVLYGEPYYVERHEVIHTSGAPTVVERTTVVERPVVIYQRPRLERIERTEIYWAPYLSYPLYYTGGCYYVYYGGVWYRSYSWRGPWVHISLLPDVFVYVPPTHPRYHTVIRYTSRRGSRSRRYAPAPSRVIRSSSRSSRAGRSSPTRVNPPRSDTGRSGRSSGGRVTR